MGKGTKRTILVDGEGTPLAGTLAGADVHEIRLAQPTLDRVYVPQRRGRPRTRVGGLGADKAYDARWFRHAMRQRGIQTAIPLREYQHRRMRGRPPAVDATLYGKRWVVERTFSWLQNFRRLTNRWDRYLSAYHGFFTVACIILCARRLA